ncbi:MAG: DUF4382 domain-containing protein [Phycisphaerae bacterium]|nr:DUF4382 domain-containing protein [Saprospiraceae bacterium]
MLRNPFISLKSILILGTLTMAATMSSCLKEPDEPNNNTDGAARARIEITDAPIDDPNVTAVFITVVDVKVNGVSWSGFSGKTTFDLLAFQKGQTNLLGEGILNAGTYTEVTLVLDTETDIHGASPGCYVKDAQGMKRKLDGGSQMAVKAKGSFDTRADETTVAIVDLDLRKAIVYQLGSTTEFQFVTDPELAASVRLMDKATTGNILGDCTDGVSGSDKIIVYAYKTGEYGVTEKFPQGTSQVYFKNAVTSSVVADDGTISLSFLKSGTYELHFISYQKDALGHLQAKGELQLNVLGPALNLLSMEVTARETINLDLVVTGILFF